MFVKSSKPKLFLCCCLVALSFVFVVEAARPLTLPRECPENEHYTDCGAPCQTECGTLGEPCYKAYFRCPDGCYCNEGFARDSTEKCIPIASCPPK